MKNENRTNITTTKNKSKKAAPKNELISFIMKGKVNETSMPDFVEICKKSQKELKRFLVSKLKKMGYETIIRDGFIYAKGEIPVLLTAHMDTVHENKIETFWEYKDKGKRVLTSSEGIGGDDRCGIYMILQIIEDLKCSILFCEDEELGGIGSDKFCLHSDLINEVSELNYMIELDRRGEKDAVFYSCDNPEFTKFVLDNTGCEKDYGTFSDISTLMPNTGIAGVNLSCGYYKEHTLSEHVILDEMLAMIERVKKLIVAEGQQQFEYIRQKYGSWYGYNYDYEDYEYGYYGNYHDSVEYMHITYIDYSNNKDGEIKEALVRGKNKNDCLVQFFMKYHNINFDMVLDYDFY